MQSSSRYIVKFATAMIALTTTISTGQAQEYYPREAGSWGGVVRNGPGMQYGQIDGLQEGDPVTLLRNTGQWMNGYPWFEIQFKNGRRGYKWGGILCGYGSAIPGLFQTCNVNNVNSGNNNSNNNNNNNHGNGHSGQAAASWGGVLRSGPGMGYAQIGSSQEGDPVTLLENSGQWMNGYPWWRIKTHQGNIAYQWGGIMCGINGPVQGLHQVCNRVNSNHNTNNRGNNGNHNVGTTGTGGRILQRTIRFAPGTISTNIRSGFARGEREHLYFDASAGQNVYISISSTEQNATFSLHPGHGESEPRIGSSQNQWNSLLPYAGRYTIVVESLRGGTSYDLFVEIQ